MHLHTDKTYIRARQSKWDILCDLVKELKGTCGSTSHTLDICRSNNPARGRGRGTTEETPQTRGTGPRETLSGFISGEGEREENEELTKTYHMGDVTDLEKTRRTNLSPTPIHDNVRPKRRDHAHALLLQAASVSNGLCTAGVLGLPLETAMPGLRDAESIGHETWVGGRGARACSARAVPPSLPSRKSQIETREAL
jgi:hypothetical protein